MTVYKYCTTLYDLIRKYDWVTIDSNNSLYMSVYFIYATIIYFHPNMHFTNVGYMLSHIEIMKCFTESLFSSWMPIAGSNLTFYKLPNSGH